MGIILGLGGLVTLIALILKAQLKGGAANVGEGGKPYATGLPDTVKQTIMRGEEATRTELEIAASSATVAGYPKLGEALLEKAQKAPDRSAASKGPESPWKEVSDADWRAFIKAMAVGKPNTVSPRGSIGIFQMTVRRLADFGLMRNPRKTGADGVWTADWAIDPKRFMSDPALQYKVFEKSMSQYRSLILERYRAAIGTSFEGKQATLSGLLAVAHHAGAEGLAKWLKNDPPRSKFKATTAAYARANGIF